MGNTSLEPRHADSADHGSASSEGDGQPTTVEEAMDAATHEDGFAEESSYTPSEETMMALAETRASDSESVYDDGE